MMHVRRSYVDVSFGQMHVAEAGIVDTRGDRPIVLLHQTPRSWDEFAEAIPALVQIGHVIAVDLPGMGGSDAVPGRPSIAAYASAVWETLTALGCDEIDLLGHHTGGVVAFEAAVQHPARVRRLVLSSTPWVDPESRARRRERPPIDHVEIAPDGSHLAELWRRRQSFYPPGRFDLLTRFVSDALRCRDPEAGHLAVGMYEMERRVSGLNVDVLLVGHDADPFAFPELGQLRAALVAQLGDERVATTTVAGGMVPLEYTPELFVRAVRSFLTCDDVPAFAAALEADAPDREEVLPRSDTTYRFTE